eukprot:804815-Pelagomonas_calceolata.AAC.3
MSKSWNNWNEHWALQLQAKEGKPTNRLLGSEAHLAFRWAKVQHVWGVEICTKSIKPLNWPAITSALFHVFCLSGSPVVHQACLHHYLNAV